MKQPTRHHLYKKKRNQLYHQHIPVSCVTILIFFSFLGIFLYNTVSSASMEPSHDKCYKSIQIQNGDSLWSIAEQYYTTEWKDVQSYMEEIKTFNGITQDKIHIGNYIAIPYYD